MSLSRPHWKSLHFVTFYFLRCYFEAVGLFLLSGFRVFGFHQSFNVLISITYQLHHLSRFVWFRVKAGKPTCLLNDLYRNWLFLSKWSAAGFFLYRRVLLQGMRLQFGGSHNKLILDPVVLSKYLNTLSYSSLIELFTRKLNLTARYDFSAWSFQCNIADSCEETSNIRESIVSTTSPWLDHCGS